MQREISIESIYHKYKDEWVALSVTERDEYFVPVKGEILFHGVDKKEVYDSGFNAQKANAEIELYCFYTGEVIPEDMAVMLHAV